MSYEQKVSPSITKVDLSLLALASQTSDEANIDLRRTLATGTTDADTIYRLGVMAQQQGNLAEAEAAYRRVVELKPDFAGVHNDLGILLAATLRCVEAEAAYLRAVEIKPDFAEAYNNLGILLSEAKRFVEAEAAFRRALESKPDFAEAIYGLGSLFAETRSYVEAEAAYRRALALKPGSPEVRYSLGVLLLRSGRYAEAWEHYESRHTPSLKNGVLVAPNYLPFPEWRGERLDGKSIVIWAEEGCGDQVQFVRYVSLLKRCGASRITLVCHPALKRLLETVEGVDTVTTNPNIVTLHDYWALFLSLPLRFGTTVETVPTRVLYVFPLRERTERWRKRLPVDGLRVGLVWKGSVLYRIDANRSLPAISALAPLWSVPGVTFVSLQKGQGENEALQPPVGQPLMPLGQDIGDFAATAAIVAQLDLIICVDTAIAHVAGALARPCWVLLQKYHTDWRWMEGRTDSAWYPKEMRLFRQTQYDDWSVVIEEVTVALESWAMTHPRAQSNRR